MFYLIKEELWNGFVTLVEVKNNRIIRHSREDENGNIWSNNVKNSSMVKRTGAWSNWDVLLKTHSVIIESKELITEENYPEIFV